MIDRRIFVRLRVILTCSAADDPEDRTGQDRTGEQYPEARASSQGLPCTAASCTVTVNSWDASSYAGTQVRTAVRSRAEQYRIREPDRALRSQSSSLPTDDSRTAASDSESYSKLPPYTPHPVGPRHRTGTRGATEHLPVPEPQSTIRQTDAQVQPYKRGGRILYEYGAPATCVIALRKPPAIFWNPILKPPVSHRVVLVNTVYTGAGLRASMTD
ncbi:hypothetical protein EVG20_g11616, partial [Dentipellis fragilis]